MTYRQRACLTLSILASILAVLPFAASLVAAGPDNRTYTIIDLGTLGGTESFAYAINNRGDVVGSSRLSGDSSLHAFFYRSGSLVDLSPFNSGNLLTVGPTDVNNAGQIASGVIHNGVYVPAIYDISTGEISALGSLGGVTSFGFGGVATSINDRGRVVGYSYVDAHNWHAFQFSDGVMTDIGSFGGYSAALAINDDGDIAGFASETVSGYPHAFVYSDGVMTQINPFNGPNNESSARGINNHGQVVGEALNEEGTAFHGFIFLNGSIENIGTLAGGRNSVAFSINDHAQVVGVADSPYHDMCFIWGAGWVPCIKYRERAFLYQHGTIVDLNLLIGPDTGWELKWAFDINNRGQIIGVGIRGGKFRAYLMTPVRKPHRCCETVSRRQRLKGIDRPR